MKTIKHAPQCAGAPSTISALMGVWKRAPISRTDLSLPGCRFNSAGSVPPISLNLKEHRLNTNLAQLKYALIAVLSATAPYLGYCYYGHLRAHASREANLEAIRQADERMRQNGYIRVGDHGWR